MALSEAQQRNAEENRRYWQTREEEALRHYITDEAEYSRHIQEIYANMLDNVQREIDAFYARYARAEGITLAEAKKRVSQADIAAYERRAARYVRDKDFSARANEELRLYNAMMRINRLEMLKANIGLETIAGHDELEKYMAGILQGRTMEELTRQAGILGHTIQNNARLANAIVNGSFKNGTFSDRIWQYQDAMREDLGKLLQTGLIQGKNPRALASDLRKYWYGNDPRTGGGARYCMERLMRTELARVQTEAQKQSFQRNGFDKYLFIVNANCCDICKELSKKDVGFGKGVFLVEDMMPGDNAPPVHPHCRCSTAAYEDDDEYQAWLDHLANGGTTAEWDAMKTAKLALENSENGVIINAEARALPSRFKKYLPDPKRRLEIIEAGKNLERPIFADRLLGTLAKNITPLSNYYDVVLHGEPYGFEYFGEKIDVETLCAIIAQRQDYTKGTNIRLISCDTGAAADGVAQYIADKLNVVVLAPDKKAIVERNIRGVTEVYSGSASGVHDGEFIPFEPSERGK